METISPGQVYCKTPGPEIPINPAPSSPSPLISTCVPVGFYFTSKKGVRVGKGLN